MEAKAYLGKKVRKFFESGWFDGKVVSVDTENIKAAEKKETAKPSKPSAKRKRGRQKTGPRKAAKTLFGIKYADGDTEDVYVTDLKKMLEAYNAEDEQVKKALELKTQFVGKSILFAYKKEVLEAKVTDVRLVASKARKPSKIVFDIKLKKETHTTDEKTVSQGIKYFEFEQDMQKFLAKHRAQYKGAAVAKYFDGQRFTGSVVSVERQVEKPQLSGGSSKRLLYHIKYSDGDEEDVFLYELKEMKELAEMIPKLDAALAKHKGAKVTKVFTDTAFDGKVVAVDIERKRKRKERTVLYRVKFSDGDEMDMYEEEVVAAAAAYKKEPAAKFNKRPLSERKPADTGKKGKGRPKKTAKKPQKPQKPATKPTRVSARTAKKTIRCR